MRINKTLAASGLFFVFLVFGGAWVSLVQLVPAGLPRSILILAFGVAFAGVFVWLLIQRVQGILAGEGALWKHLVASLVQLALLILAFAFVYQKVGIMDSTQSGSPIVHDFASAAYYSVVTFTTLGYGDFYPVGVGRALAALEAFTGYLILGILASTGATLLKSRATENEG